MRSLGEVDDGTLALLGVDPVCGVAARQFADSPSESLADLAVLVEQALSSAHDVRTWMRTRALARVLSAAVAAETSASHRWMRELADALVAAGVQPGATVQPLGRGAVLVGTVRIKLNEM